jgi:hypothetical protein
LAVWLVAVSCIQLRYLHFTGPSRAFRYIGILTILIIIIIFNIYIAQINIYYSI